MKRVVARESQIVGTYDEETLVALLNGGTLKLVDQYWDATTSTWRPLTDFIGYAAPVRRFGPPLLRVMTLLIAAACGSLATWWSVKNSAQQNVGVPALAAPTEPPKGGTPTPTPALTPPASIKHEEKKAPAPALVLLNVEVFDEEVAVTVQNNGLVATTGFDLKLKYFVLPGDQLVFDSNEKSITQHEAATLERTEKAKALDAMLGALERNLKLVSTDVITWTPSHIKALPTVKQWLALDDRALGTAGAALTKTALAFSAGASSADPAVRNKALTGHLPDLALQLEKMKPLLKRAIEQTTTARERLTAGQNDDDAGLARLKRQQRELQPRLVEWMTVARKKTIRTEIVHTGAVIEPGLVRRITVKRVKNERHGVAVELARPDEKAVALSGW